MENTELKLILRDYSTIEELSNKELIELIKTIVDIEEVPSALNELYKRNRELSLKLSQNILREGLGDIYLQGAVIDFIFEHNKLFIFDFFQDNLGEINYYLFACILENFTIESEQKFAKNITKEILDKIANRYNSYSEIERNKIKNKFDLFMTSYKKYIN